MNLQNSKAFYPFNNIHVFINKWPKDASEVFLRFDFKVLAGQSLKPLNKSIQRSFESKLDLEFSDNKICSFSIVSFVDLTNVRVLLDNNPN